MGAWILLSIGSFNHNRFYHRVLLQAVPAHCPRALDVGCGTGLFASALARRAELVEAVDKASQPIGQARRQWAGIPNLSFAQADFADYAPHPGGYQFVSCLAALHHMPFAETVAKLRDALAPGGVLAVLGCYREATMADYLHDLVAVPANLVARLVLRHPDAGVVPPVAKPQMSIPEIRRRAAPLLPGMVMTRRLFWRYTLFYRPPDFYRRPDPVGAAPYPG